jgi:spore photoproduct lyase
VLKQYEELIEELHKLGLLADLEYISLGVVRFTKDSYKKVSEHYPNSLIHQGIFKKEGKDKVKYPSELRVKILSSIEKQLIARGLKKERVYWCME